MTDLSSRLPIQIKKLIRIISRIDPRPVRHCPVMIIDQDGAHNIVQALDDIPATVIPVRGERYLLPPPVLLRILLEMVNRQVARLLLFLFPKSEKFRQMRQKRSGYVQLCIDILKPKVVTTFTDNDIRFFHLAANNQHIPFIAVQNGIRTYSKIKEAPEPRPVPVWMLTMSEQERQNHIQKGYNPERIIVAGSLCSSLSRRNSKVVLPHFDICIVSQWRASIHGHPFDFPLYGAANNRFNQNASRYVREKGLNAVIAAGNGGDDEDKYFRDFYGDDVTIHRRFSGINVYDCMKASDLVLSMNSTASIEAFASGNKILLLDYPSESDIYEGYQGAEEILIRDDSYEAFVRHADAIRAMSAEEWLELSRKLSRLARFDTEGDPCDILKQMVTQFLNS